MPTSLHYEPWEQLTEILKTDDPQSLRAYFDTLSPGEIARAISRLNQEEQERIFTLLAPADSADLLEELPETQAADLLEELPVTRAAAILDRMPSDEQTDLLGEMDAADAATILREMDPEEAEDVRQLSQYPSESAGGLMITEYLTYPDSARVVNVIDDLRTHAEQYARYDVQYAYVTSQTGVLIGVLQLRDLLLSAAATPVTTLMIPHPLDVRADTPLEALEQFFDRHTFFGVPVIDEADRSGLFMTA